LFFRQVFYHFNHRNNDINVIITRKNFPEFAWLRSHGSWKTDRKSRRGQCVFPPLTHPCAWGDSTVPVRGFSSIDSYVLSDRLSQIGGRHRRHSDGYIKIRHSGGKSRKMLFLKNLMGEKDFFIVDMALPFHRLECISRTDCPRVE